MPAKISISNKLVMKGENAATSPGERLVDCLSTLGYPKVNDLRGDSLDWIFEHEQTVPFLEWLCDSVNESNVLSQEEIEQYEVLVSSGAGILEGKQLEQSLTNTSHTEDYISPKIIRDEIESFSQLSTRLSKNLQNLEFQKNKLSLHHARLSHKLTQVRKTEGDAKLKYKRCLQQSQTDNKQINGVKSEVAEALSKLTALHSQQGDSQAAPFLSEQSFDEHLAAEEKFTAELTAYTRKQFFEGIAEITGQEGTSRYELLEISDPTNLLIRGESQNVTLNDCREIARLQSVFVCREGKRIDHEAMSVGIAAALNHAERKAQNILRQDTATLDQKMQEVQRSLAQNRKDIIELTDKELPNLLREVAELQSTKILQGDYHLKIARQDYFTSKQDQVINQLMLQRSRHEFLGMSLEVEALRHRETHGLFTTVENMLQKNVSSLELRKHSLEGLSQEPGNPKRGTIDWRDKFMGRMHELLTRPPSFGSDECGEVRSNLFLTYSSMLECADQLLQQLSSFRASVANTDGQQEDTLKQFEEKLYLCGRMVYSGTTTERGLPQLSPQHLADSLVQLKQLLQTLEQLIRDVIKDIDGRKKILRSDGLKTLERDLFVCFFNDTPRLKRTISELSAQVDAQLVTMK